MKKLSVLLAVPLLALGACGGGEAGNNAAASGNEAAPAAANDMNAAGAVSKPTEEAEPAEGDNASKPAADAGAGDAGAKPAGAGEPENMVDEGAAGTKPTQ